MNSEVGRRNSEGKRDEGEKIRRYEKEKLGRCEGKKVRRWAMGK